MKSRSPIRKVSGKRAAAYAGPTGRRAFVSMFLRLNPECEAKLLGRCTIKATDVHESISRGRTGAIVPGEKADAQGQVFIPACNPCNRYVEDHPVWARSHGFTKSRYGNL